MRLPAAGSGARARPPPPRASVLFDSLPNDTALTAAERELLSALAEEPDGAAAGCDPVSIGHDDCVSAVEDPLRFAEAVDAAWRSGTSPVQERAAPLPPRGAVLESHAAALGLYERLLAERGRVCAVAMAAPLTHGPVPALERHAPISLAECAAAANRLWAGRALFVRTAAPAVRWVATRVVVEDTAGAVLPLNLYNFVPPALDPQRFLPEGSFLALLEPCASVFAARSLFCLFFSEGRRQCGCLSTEYSV